MAVGKEAAPKPDGRIIVQAKEIAGNRAAREATEHHARLVPAKLLANGTDRVAEVFQGGLRIVPRLVTPPRQGEVIARRIKIWHAQPDETTTGREPVAQVAALGSAGADVAELVGVAAIAGQLHQYGQPGTWLPVGRQIQHVINPLVQRGGKDALDPLAGGGCPFAQCGHGEIGGDGPDVRQFGGLSRNSEQQQTGDQMRFHR